MATAVCQTGLSFLIHLSVFSPFHTMFGVWFCRALEAACAAYASLNLSLLHYITLYVGGNLTGALHVL